MISHDEIKDYLQNAQAPQLRYFPFRVAAETSDLAAILLYDLQGRIRRQKKKNIKDRLQWTYDKMELFAKTHSVSKSGIRKAFLALEAKELIKIRKDRKYNGRGFDPKWWYHVTEAGMKASCARLIRFNPDVATALDIPKAVILEHFRFKLHKDNKSDFVSIDPSKLGIPYSPKTIKRHLAALTELGILERSIADGNQYCIVASEDWRTSNPPLTIPPEKLLPKLKAGDVGLLVGHSGTGKTSVSSFTAVQMAVAGTKVLYVTLEEPPENIQQRMQAGEFGLSYSEIHKGSLSANAQLDAEFANPSERLTALKNNLRFIDLAGVHPQSHEIQDAILAQQEDGFLPDVVFIDQLEWFTAVWAPTHKEDAFGIGTAVENAMLIRDCLVERQFVTWVNHQVIGGFQWDYTAKKICGGDDVTDRFDCVVGIGRETNDSPQLRLFSMTKKVKFEQILESNFETMRFLPLK